MYKIKKPCGFHKININNFGVSFSNQEVLRDVNLVIGCGTLCAIIGRNGAGKSTLVKAILGQTAHTGDISISDTTGKSVRNIRIGYVPQSIDIDKNIPMSVYDLIVSYRYDYPMLFKSKKIRQEIITALRDFEVDDLIDAPIGKLSGGQLQRVLLSMAIYDTPDLLILDEPVSGIDKNGMDLFYDRINYLKKNFDMAIILISHDLDYVARYADDVVLLDKSVVMQGSPKKVYNSNEFKSVFGGLRYDYELPMKENTHTHERDEAYDASYKGDK